MCFSKKKKAIKSNSTPTHNEDRIVNHQTGRNLTGGNTSMNPSREWRGLNK